MLLSEHVDHGHRRVAASSSRSSWVPVHADRVHHPREHERHVTRRPRREPAEVPPRAARVEARPVPTRRSRTRPGCGWRGLSNTSATLLPSSAREASRSDFSSIARSSRPRCSSRAVSSSPVRKCFFVVMRVLSWNLYHGRDFPPDKTPVHVAVAAPADHGAGRHACPGEPALLRDEFARSGSAPSGTWRCSRRHLRSGSATLSAGARAPTGCACSRRATAAPPAAPGRGTESRPDRLEGGRVEPVSRAPPGRIIEHRRLTLTRRPSNARMVGALELGPG